MFTVYYEEWTKTGTECTGTHASPSSTSYVSGKDMKTSTKICAYDAHFHYMNGVDSTGTTIAATTQMFTVYTDNAVVTAASAFALAGVAAMFF